MCLQWPPSYLEVLEGDDLGLDEATLEVRVDHTRRLPQSTHREASDPWLMTHDSEASCEDWTHVSSGKWIMGASGHGGLGGKRP